MGRRPKDWQPGSAGAYDINGQPMETADADTTEDTATVFASDGGEGDAGGGDGPSAALDIRARILELLRDPEIAREAIAAALQTEEGRAVLSGIRPPKSSARPFGEYKRDYSREAPLRVFGGVMVAHPAGFVPLPPSYIPRWEAVDGGTTDHEDRAARDSSGAPIRTEMYKYWLELQMRGEHMESAVKSDIAAGVFAGGVEDGEFVPQRDDPGLPI